MWKNKNKIPFGNGTRNFNLNKAFHTDSTPRQGINRWKIPLPLNQQVFTKLIKFRSLKAIIKENINLIRNLKKLKHQKRLTLKLLCTNVSSKSITIHFLCVSWCRTGGNRCLCRPCNVDTDWPLLNTGNPFCVGFFRFRRQQQNIDWIIPRCGDFRLSTSSVKKKQKKFR